MVILLLLVGTACLLLVGLLFILQYSGVFAAFREPYGAYGTKFVEAKRRENGSKSEAGAPNFGGCDWCFHTKNVDAKRSSDFIGGLATVGAE